MAVTTRTGDNDEIETSMWALKWLGIELVEVSLQEKLISAIGAGLAIYFVLLITRSALPADSTIGVIASMGASAVLLFAVPHGQLSQPWPLIGGHTISAIIGVGCAQAITDAALAAAIAVGASIAAMHQSNAFIHRAGLPPSPR